ncbi:lantibiotic dehydratase [Streptomyces sp. NBC_01465]|uniref:lantibiotic dehydratase n=1 Tax=Streptomyces sp. NBC_01465 TaxID=2903878 RepID=UPI002E336FFE|nr:lantibiotic dehydratase [Streptomyces sp. NBC_01465]
MGGGTYYRHTGVALLRAAVTPLTETPQRWPDMADPADCRTWLAQVWGASSFAASVRDASVWLAERVETILGGEDVPLKAVHSVVLSVARYHLRATGRPTPFGGFAGVADVTVGERAEVRWGQEHRSIARADTQWLASVVDRVEALPELLERTEVVFNNLAAARGSRLEVPRSGTDRTSIRFTPVVRAVREAAQGPVGFSLLGDKVAAAFGAERATVVAMLTELVQRGFLITRYRAPLTVTAPLAYVIAQLRQVGADEIPAAGPTLRILEAADFGLRRHNEHSSNQAELRRRLAAGMREGSSAGRSPLAVDLRLDCTVEIPRQVAWEMERAAHVLLRLTRQPTGQAVWAQYFTEFWERYGTGTLVPVNEVIDPAAGLGFPAEYPGSTRTSPASRTSERDEQLLALAWQATVERSGEVILTDQLVDELAADRLDERRIPPHVEMATRVHAVSVEALTRGQFTLAVAPARSAGTLTSRFTTTAAGSGLREVFRTVPTEVHGALPVQMSFPPVFPHSENIARIPAYLPHVVSLGEHRPAGGTEEPEVIPLDDLAITATHNRLYLVSCSRQQVIETQVFHALALDKQPPPLARFLTNLNRAFSPAWTGFDWGPVAFKLLYLPRVRYGRTVLSPARWQLSPDTLPSAEGEAQWCAVFNRWRQQWNCPRDVELRDEERCLRLDLDVPLHQRILRTQLARSGTAVLTEAADADAYGWIGGHVHEVAMPLVRKGPPAQSPLTGRRLPLSANCLLGWMPGAPSTPWINVKVFTHPDYMDEIITEGLPRLLAELGVDPEYWFLRYRSPHESDHLRLRLRTHTAEQYALYAAQLGAWAEKLRAQGMTHRLTLDVYSPETGRYGTGETLGAAETVFAADSRTVAASLHHLPSDRFNPAALAAVNMVNIARGLLGADAGLRWMANHPVPAGTPTESRAATLAVILAEHTELWQAPGMPAAVTDAWYERSNALATYGHHLDDDQLPAVLESLLHMHHNRALGIDPAGEKSCRHLAFKVARALRARTETR